MHRGYIKLQRRIVDWEWYSDHNTTRLFIHLLLKANHKPGRWRGTVIPAGSLVTGRKVLAAETGLSEQNIRTSLSKLKASRELTIKKTNKCSIIAVNNWGSYQITNQQSNQQLTSHQPTTNQQLTTNKNGKNEENDKKGEKMGADSFFVAIEKINCEYPKIKDAIAAVCASHEAFAKVNKLRIENSLIGQPDRLQWHEAITGMAAKYAGAEMKFPNRTLQNWLAGKIGQDHEGESKLENLI